MVEELLVTARYNAKVDPVLGIWTWEIAFYLFMGGMAAGIMLFSAWAVLTRDSRTFSGHFLTDEEVEHVEMLKEAMAKLPENADEEVEYDLDETPYL